MSQVINTDRKGTPKPADDFILPRYATVKEIGAIIHQGATSEHTTVSTHMETKRILFFMIYMNSKK